MEYKSCAEYAIKNLKNELDGKRDKKNIYIFEYSSPAKLFISYFHKMDMTVKGMIDNRPEKIGKEFQNVKVLSVEQFCQLQKDKSVVLCEKGKAKKLEEMTSGSDNTEIIEIDVYNYKASEDCLDWSESKGMIEIAKAQEEMMKILKWFHYFCEKNHLHYTLYSGSLIGAIRHQGFIPWDDDVDVIMPAKDYFKCCELLSEEEEYEFLSIFNNKEYFTSTISKLLSKKYKREERNFPLRQKMGIGIDIWPLGGFPNDISGQKVFSDNMEKIGNEWKKKVVIPYGTSLFCKRDYEQLVKKIKETILKYDLADSRWASCIYCGTFGFNHGRSRVMLKEDYINRHLTKFETEKFWIPDGYDKILKADYGDYMILPPEEKRECKKMRVYQLG